MKEIDLAIIGNIARQKDTMLDGKSRDMIGGSAYYVGAGASIFSDKAGIVACVGDDIDLSILEKWGLDTSGIGVIAGEKSASFINIQLPDGSRNFSADMGVANAFHPEIFPESYLTAKFIHLATDYPQRQLLWINNLKSRISAKSTVSVDTFEAFVDQYPDMTKDVLKQVGMVFANEYEWGRLQQLGLVNLSVPFILKKGALGAVYIEGDNQIEVSAPKVDAIDTSGAGEVLAGVFLTLRAKGVGIGEALEKAVRTASLKVTKPGVEHLHW